MFFRREHLVALLVAVSLAASSQPSYAQWQLNGVPLFTTATNGALHAENPGNVMDGANGAIVVWAYNGTYAQRVNSAGAVQWGANGVTTEIAFTSRPQSVALKIFDVSGKLVRKLSDGVLPPGRHSALWNRRDDRGRQVPAGIYFYSLTAQGKRRSSRMVVE